MCDQAAAFKEEKGDVIEVSGARCGSSSHEAALVCQYFPLFMSSISVNSIILILLYWNSPKAILRCSVVNSLFICSILSKFCSLSNHGFV